MHKYIYEGVRGVEELPTPCFLMDRRALRNNVRLWQKAIDCYFARGGAVGYSVKTNSLPEAIRYAGELGCLAEVVSHDEYCLARRLGFAPERIVYNGPMKSKETFLEAIRGGAVVNIECHRELEWLSELPTDEQYSVGLRVNIDISQISPADAKEGDSYSRFGFSVETGEFDKAYNTLSRLPNIRLAGLHFHRTSRSRSLDFYRHLAAYAGEVICRYRPADGFDYIDMGGGYYGIWPGAPTFNEYIKTIATELERTGAGTDFRLIIEPGNGLVANAFHFLSSVVDTKTVADRRVVTTDGSRIYVDPLFKKNSYHYEVLPTDASRSIEPLQTVCGGTCLEFDHLFDIQSGAELRPGDRLLYKNVGAYTMTLTPLFINLFPTVYAYEPDGGEVELIRRRWSADQLI